MIDAALGIDMLARSDHHVFVGRDVDQRWLAGVCMGYPDGDGEAIGSTAEDDGDGAREEEEESRDAIVKGVGVGAWRKRRVLRETGGDVVVRAVDIVVFLEGDCKQDRTRPTRRTGIIHWSGRCRAS